MFASRTLVALSFVCLCLSGCGQTVEVPTADLNEAQPAVIEKFEKARASVIENPDFAEAWGQLGMMFNAYAINDRALVCYRRAAELDPKEFRWSYLAAVLLAELDPEKSEEKFRLAAKLNSNYAPLYCNLAMSLVKTGREDEAQHEYETALAIDPKCRAALLGLGQLKLQQGELSQSLEYLSKAADLRFEDNQVHTLLARLYHRMGNSEFAEIEQNLARAYPLPAPPRDEIRARVQAQATGVNQLRGQGEKLFNRGRFTEAEEVYRQIISDPPSKAYDHTQLGRALAEQGKLPEAIKELEIALEMDDKDDRILRTYGLLMARAGETEKASELLEKAIEVNPGSDISHFYAAMVSQQLGNEEIALEGYRKVLELNPANAPGHLYLANLLSQQGDTEQAIKHWRLASIYNPTLYQAFFALVKAYNDNEQHAKTDELLRQKLERKPDDVVVLKAFATHLATCPDSRFQDHAKAIRVAEKMIAIRGVNDTGALMFLSAVFAETGDFERAIATLEEARKANAGSQNNPAMARQIEFRRQQYRDGKSVGL